MPKAPNQVGGTLQRIDHYPEHLRAIGLVITDFGGLECGLCLLLWELLEDPIKASAVFWSLGSSNARCNVIRGVTNARYADTDLGKEINRIVAKVRSLAEQRNDIAHAQWGTPAEDPTNPFMSIQRPATKNPVFERRWKITELDALANKISDAHIQVDQITMVLTYINNQHSRQYIEHAMNRIPKLDSYIRKFL